MTAKEFVAANKGKKVFPRHSKTPKVKRVIGVSVVNPEYVLVQGADGKKSIWPPGDLELIDTKEMTSAGDLAIEPKPAETIENTPGANLIKKCHSECSDGWCHIAYTDEPYSQN